LRAGRGEQTGKHQRGNKHSRETIPFHSGLKWTVSQQFGNKGFDSVFRLRVASSMISLPMAPVAFVSPEQQ
jgi:hypothetical protein